MSLILSYIIGTVAYAFIAILTYVFTTYGPVLPFWNYRPWTCYKCFRFWCSWWVAIGMALTGHTAMGITLAFIASMDAIAMDYEETNETEYVEEDYDDDEEEIPDKRG